MDVQDNCIGLMSVSHSVKRTSLGVHALSFSPIKIIIPTCLLTELCRYGAWGGTKGADEVRMV